MTLELSHPPTTQAVSGEIERIRQILVKVIIDQLTWGFRAHADPILYVLREAGLTIEDDDVPGPWTFREFRLAAERSSHHRKRAKRHGCKRHFLPAEWLKLLDIAGGCCVICGCSDRQLTVEHKVPLAEGGSNEISNIAPTCEACNTARNSVGDDYLKKITGWGGFEVTDQGQNGGDHEQ